MTVGFIGLGIMGSRMAANLIQSGVQLLVFNRTKDKAESLLKQGAIWGESLETLAKKSDVIITMLSKPEIIQEIAFGSAGFAQHFTDKTWIDCSTINPSFAKKMAEKSKKQGVSYLEAPVAGTKGPAEKGELVFFVGGNQDKLIEYTPLFDAMGKKTIYAGNTGKGAAIKMTVNLMLGANMLAFAEAISLGTHLGVEEATLHQVLLNSPVSAGFLSVIQGKLIAKDLEANFPLQWMQKDLGLAVKTAQELNIQLPSTQTGAKTFAKATEKDWGEHDFSAIYHFLNQKSQQDQVL